MATDAGKVALITGASAGIGAAGRRHCPWSPRPLRAALRHAAIADAGVLGNDAPMASAHRSRRAHSWACTCLVLAMSLGTASTVVAQQPVASTAPSEMEGVIRRFYELRARTLDDRGTAQDVT